MTEFWESAFNKKQLMWGLAPTTSASAARDIFNHSGAKSVLIPGIGYGRNARPFLERGMSVAGIEISETAIELARSRLGLEIPIVHGSVADMPFDRRKYDGVFCHGLVYLLDARGRRKLIRDCYRQLAPGGHMVFTVISKKAPMYGQGPRLGDDWYERLPGLPMYFYDAESVKREFGPYGLVELSEFDEPAGDGATLPFIKVVCRRDAVTVSAAEAVDRLHAGQVEVTVAGALQQSEVAAIAGALETSTTSILTMGGCQITDMGGVAIANALLTNSALRELWLFNNEINDAGGKAFGDALRSNASLTTLCLNENRVGDVGAAAIGEALRSSQSLVELGLGRNQIGDIGGAAIGGALAFNSSVIALSLNHNHIGDAGAASIGGALRNNASLRILRLSHNEIGDSGAEAVRAGVAHNSVLRTVSFEENPASASLHQEIKTALERDP
ncbi:methyltransferase domain-containing protein [Sorangium sp. So ce295]|uniref:methyltransferase domain-containing protein n=1 Tax=Sorangium sp. So ce295 TaxID=3133295 RepID=UPI003F5FF422